MKYIDAHCHLGFKDYDTDCAEVFARMKAADVSAIAVGVDLESSKREVALAEQSARNSAQNESENGNGQAADMPAIFAAVGLHPIDNSTELMAEFDYAEYKKLAEHPRVVAIGECGLDYSRLKSLTDPDSVKIIARQKEIFQAQIALAREVGKPLMLHIRSSARSLDAYEDAYEILKNDMAIAKSLSKRPPGNVHFFAGDWAVAQKFLSLGFTLSFTGVITFARNYDEVIRNAPLDMILSETDAPFVAPVPFRGKRNEPVYVTLVADKIAEIRGETSPEGREKVRAALVRNTIRVFRLS